MKPTFFTKQFPFGTLEGISIGEGPETWLLHGFPETPSYWLPVVAQMPNRKWMLPWLPGILGSQLNTKFELLTAARLVSEAISASQGPTDLVGFDWGGGLAWFVNAMSPQNLNQTIVLAAPYPKSLASVIASDPEQAQRASYMRYFMRPDLREKLLQSDFKAFLMVKPAAFQEAATSTISEAKKAWSDPTYTAAMAHYYSALLDDRASWIHGLDPELSHLTWLWADQDEFFVESNLNVASDLAGVRVQRLPGASHFSHLADPRAMATTLAHLLEPAL